MVEFTLKFPGQLRTMAVSNDLKCKLKHNSSIKQQLLFYIVSNQAVKYSEEFNYILDNYSLALEVKIEYGSLSPIKPGASISISASAPYTTGKNIFIVVQVTGINSQTVI